MTETTTHKVRIKANSRLTTPNGNELPKGWQLKKLGEVCEIKNGKNQKAVVNPNGKYPIYGSAGIMGFANQFICEAGTTIVGRKGTINKPIFVNTQFWNVDTAFGFSPFSELLDSKFLFFFCQSFNFHKLDKSTTIPSLAKSDLLKIEIILPPLPEQQAIVAKIEELLSELENGKQQLLIAQQQLKVYRQSLLKWAFEGKLTNKKVKDGELPKGWTVLSLKDVCTKITDGSHFSPKSTAEGYPYVTVRDIKNDKIDFENCLKISTDDFKNLTANDCRPLENDLLFSKDGTVGKVSLVDYDFNFVVLSSIGILRTNTNVIIPKYLYYVLKSSEFLHQALNQKKGVAIRRIILRDLKELKLNVPKTINEQQRIVDELESKLTVCDKIEETISQSLQQAETLRQSILKKAFEGKLI